MTHPITPSQNSRWGRFFCRFALLLLVSSLGLVSSPFISAVQAQGEADPARQRFIEGRELYAAGEYREAARAFLEAFELSGRTELLYNVGQAYRNAGAYEEAERYFQKYLAEQPDAPNAEEVVETIIEIQQALASASGTLDIRTRPDGTPIFINDEPGGRCTSPCNVSLDAGEYTVHARKPGFEPARERVVVESSGRQEIEFVLRQAAAQGRLLVRTDVRQGTLRIAPHIEESLPLREAVSVAAGPTMVELRSGGKVAWRGEVDVAPGETTELFIPMLALADAQGGASTMRAVGIGLGGGAIAFGVGALLMGMQASDTHAALEFQQERFGGVNTDLMERGQSQQTGANMLWGAAAVSLITGAGLYYWSGRQYKVDAEPQQETTYPTQDDEPTPRRPSDTTVDLLD